jgi:hypothetical protein
VNPSKKELLDIATTSAQSWDAKGRAVRFSIDLKNKKVYAWNVNLFHRDAANELRLRDENVIQGVAAQRGNKWIMASADEYQSYHKFKHHQLRWMEMGFMKQGDQIPDLSWADKYIDTKPYWKIRLASKRDLYGMDI